MTRAQEIVIVYGVVSISYGFALGIPLSRERSAAPNASGTSTWRISPPSSRARCTSGCPSHSRWRS